jgi:hypothetical protein
VRDGRIGREGGHCKHGGAASLGVVLLLEYPVVILSCLIGTICPVTCGLTQTLHVRPANYRWSFMKPPSSVYLPLTSGGSSSDDDNSHMERGGGSYTLGSGISAA